MKFLEEIHEAAQLLISCLHSWGLDPEIDETCISKLGLLKPVKLVSFGLLTFSKLSLIIPGWYSNSAAISSDHTAVQSDPEPTTKQRFLSHWEFCSALTTQHSLSVVALTNTLMSMTQISFLTSSEKTDKKLKKVDSVEDTKDKAKVSDESNRRKEDPGTTMLSMIRANIKAGWSRLATLYCCLLPDKLLAASYRPPLLHVLARRWQDRCLEVR